jgi:hypothetical protein
MDKDWVVRSTNGTTVGDAKVESDGKADKVENKVASFLAILPCDLGPHAWSARVFNFAQTPRAIMSNLRDRGRLQRPPSPNVRSRTPAGKHSPGSFFQRSCAK